MVLETINDDQLSLSDDECLNIKSPALFEGTLSKWTNYIHGWQERFFSLKNGSLNYYKSENEISYGSRGAISIYKCTVKLPDFDQNRFDISNGDCIWYLRAECQEMRNKWIDALEAHRNYIDSGYGSDMNLKRHGSVVSLSSNSLTSNQFQRCLREKLSEIETFRDILSQQLNTLQSYFDNCPSTAVTTSQPAKTATIVNKQKDFRNQSDSNSGGSTSTGTNIAGDNTMNDTKTISNGLKGEGMTFKATTASIITSLSQCIELMQQREENWKRRLEKEIELRKKYEDVAKQADLNSSQKVMLYDGPDYEEGPHSMIKEEEFFDALDAMLDRVDQQEEEKRQIKLRAKENRKPSSSLPEKCDHFLWPDIDRTTLEQLYYARLDVGEGEGSNSWQMFAQEGEMRLYKRELEIDGLVCDPLKAVHTVKGITGHEVCYHFFSPDVRWDWENTLESMKVIEEINQNTFILHQIHKRVWPAAQRDTVFWSHIRKVTTKSGDKNTQNLKDIWTVCNNSTNSPDVPLGRCVRMQITVSMTCETYVDPPNLPEDKITRDNLLCKIIYCSTINPGGWVPAAALRSLYKREYPKFLKRFTEYVVDAQEKKPIMF